MGKRRAKRAGGRPNILLIVSDQHSPRIMGCAGDRLVMTPNLDRLAAAGTVFSNCYCGSPLCVPSRMTMLTGRRCHRIGVWTNSCELPSLAPTFAHGLGAAGYRTVLVGRMHFIGGDQNHGFEERRVGDVSSGFLGVNRAEYRFRGFFGERESLDRPGPGPAHDCAFDAAAAAEACRIIRDHEVARDPRPLCLAVGFYSPHDPYRAPRRHWEAHRAAEDAPHDRAGAGLHPVNRARRSAAAYDTVSPASVRRARAAYRAKTSFMDELVGGILDHFAESPLSRDSLTVYTSDHGEMLGDHGLWAKSCFYDGAARVPMIAAGTGVPAGRTVAGVASLLDLGPTLLDAAGADPLPRADGRSLRTALEGGPAESGTAFVELVGTGRRPCRSIRTGPWKLNWYPGEEPELFNLVEDPLEDRNRGGDPAAREIREKLESAVFADGWSPESIAERLAAVEADRRYCARWAQETGIVDPIQWGLPAEL